MAKIAIDLRSVDTATLEAMRDEVSGTITELFTFVNSDQAKASPETTMVHYDHLLTWRDVASIISVELHRRQARTSTPPNNNRR